MDLKIVAGVLLFAGFVCAAITKIFMLIATSETRMIPNEAFNHDESSKMIVVCSAIVIAATFLIFKFKSHRTKDPNETKVSKTK